MAKGALFLLAAFVVVLAVAKSADARGSRGCDSDFDCVRGFCIRDTCSSRSNLGGPCEANIHCFGSFTCVNLFCVVPVPRDGTCDDDDDCALRNDACTQGSCVSDADPCTVNDDCTDPETCIFSECSDMSDLQQDCDDNDDCNDPNTCVEQVCVVPVVSGDSCDDSADCDADADICSGDVCTAATWTNGIRPYGDASSPGSQFSFLETLNDQLFFGGGQTNSAQPPVGKLTNPITATSTWTNGLVMNRNGVVTGVFNNQIFITGGRVGIGGSGAPLNIPFPVLLNQDLTFSTSSNNAFRMPTPVHSACGAQVGTKLFVFGGSSVSFFTTLSTAVQVFDSVAGTWSTSTAVLPQARVYCAATLYNGLIYIFGGYTTGNTITPSILVFNPTTETFESNAGFPSFAKYGATADTVYGRIVVTGGAATFSSAPNGSNDVLAFDPVAKTFTPMTSMNSARVHHGSSVVNQDGDQILVVANGRGVALLNSIEFIKPL